MDGRKSSSVILRLNRMIILCLLRDARLRNTDRASVGESFQENKTFPILKQKKKTGRKQRELQLHFVESERSFLF